MVQTLRQAGARLMTQATRDPFAPHDLRVLPSAPGDYSNLSSFECTCGQRFIASSVEPRTPYDAPSLGHAHRIIENKRLAGVGPEQVIADVAGLAALPETTVVADANGVLHRRWNTRSVQWKSQAGRVLDRLEDVALPVSVWWTP